MIKLGRKSLATGAMRNSDISQKIDEARKRKEQIEFEKMEEKLRIFQQKQKIRQNRSKSW